MGRIASVLVLLIALALAPPAQAAPTVPSPGEVTALYAGRGGLPLWTGSDAAAARRQVMLGLLAAEERLDPTVPSTAPLAAAFARLEPAGQKQAEERLTVAALGYLARRQGGQPVTPQAAARALRLLDGADPAAPLALALSQLAIVDSLGGWVPVATVPGPAPSAPPLKLVSPETNIAPYFPPRKQVPEIGSLRQRLVQSADLWSRYREGPAEMDGQLTDAVRRFQQRHGLAPDGVAGERTVAMLNAGIAEQIATVRLNLARPQEDRSGLPRYVEVNVPGFQLKLVDQGRAVLRSRVIVGDVDSATPIFDDRIRFIELNPSWYVPDSITPELREKEQKLPGYLEANGFYWRAPDKLVQKPGPENALGRIKFLFPNHHAVYLHDTPQRGMLSRSQRDLSHGCVRVERPGELAVALLAPQGWDARRLDEAFASEKTRRIVLDPPVPVFLDYRTAFVDENGRLNLRPDLYGFDQAGIVRFPDKGLPPEPAPIPPAPVATVPAPLEVSAPPPAASPPQPAAYLAPVQIRQTPL